MILMKYESTIIIATCAAAVTFLSYLILNFVYNLQSAAFIDEIYHIRQAQLYCHDNWTEWDPKITTLPGLYVVSCTFLKPLQYFNENFCSIYALRVTNLIATFLNFILTFQTASLLEMKYKVQSSRYLRILTSLNMTIFPPLYFFTFLYYTDVWSVTFVLATYYFHLTSNLIGVKFSKFGAFTAGFLAVLMRQTNIIWVGLMILDDLWSLISKNTKVVAIQDYNLTKKIMEKFVSDWHWRTLCNKLENLFINTVQKSSHNLFICLTFIGFVIVNKGIVLGDKEAHSATFHPMQNFYFLIFAAFFAFPFLITECFSLWKKPPNVFLVLSFATICGVLSDLNKLEHPYLLADNRHLAFYLWKRIFGHSDVRRMLIPFYVLSALLLWRQMQKRTHFSFLVMLSFCIFLNLTPQYLFELRYFIVPFLMCRLHFRQNLFVILESLFFITINAAVIYLFVYYPFVWPSEPNTIQRFIW